MPERLDTQVLVVGAGPVGLMLAGELRLGGADVLVVERLAEPTGESRASQLSARTMEVLDQRGLLDLLGPAESVTSGHFGGIALDAGRIRSSHPGYWKIPQFRTEAALEKWASGLGADIRRDHELRALTNGDEWVEAAVDGPAGPVLVRASYLVGCDGGQSTVRRLAGFEFPGADAARELLRADVAGIEIPNRRFERLEHGLAIAARRGDGVTRVMLHEFGAPAGPRTEPPKFEEVVSGWARITGEDIGGGTPIWVDAFDDAARHVTRYRMGRVLLAGDAALIQLPAGGQSLNVGLQAAVNLGWKLAASARGRAPDGLLDTYHDERHPVAARVLDNVRAQAHLLLGGPEVEPVRTVLRDLLAIDEAADRLATMVGGLDVRYDVGPGDHPLLGARMPQFELTTESGPTSTSRLLHPARGVFLRLSDDAPRIAEGWRDRVRTVTARGDLSGAAAVLVRPDGHVAWIDGGAAELEAALHRWFGS